MRRFALWVACLTLLGSSLQACGDTDSDGTGTADSGDPFACENGKDLASGFESCDGGWAHRSSVVECGAGTAESCEQGCESLCKPNAICGHVGYAGCFCSATCKTDADCGAGALCACGDAHGLCVKAACETDADCGAGMHCATYASLDTCGIAPSYAGVSMGGFACQTSADTCTGDGDCATGERCTLEGGKRVCAKPLPCSS